VAGAFGFPRMLADVPVGLFITHHLARALTVAPLFLASGALVMTLGGEFSTVLLGRVLMGGGHTLSMLAGITPPGQVAWRVALYRVSIDGEMFLGPVLASLPSAHHAGALPAALIVVMVSLAVTLLLQTRAAGAVVTRR